MLHGTARRVLKLKLVTMILLLGNAPEPIWPIQAAAGYSYVNSDSTATTALGRARS